MIIILFSNQFDFGSTLNMMKPNEAIFALSIRRRIYEIERPKEITFLLSWQKFFYRAIVCHFPLFFSFSKSNKKKKKTFFWSLSSSEEIVCLMSNILFSSVILIHRLKHIHSCENRGIQGVH